MSSSIEDVARIGDELKQRLKNLPNPAEVLKAPELTDLLASIALANPNDRPALGKAVNELKQELQRLVSDYDNSDQTLDSTIDLTAPFDVNTPKELRPGLGKADEGTFHPIGQEITQMLDIYYRMGFTAESSRQLDDDFHMFGSLNFPPNHPARDDYDTFVTEDGLIAPAHTSTMQNRVMKKYAGNLKRGEPIAVVIPGRVFRNEDVDATHEHTFYQLEGVYVDKGINVGNLIAVLKTFMSEYYEQDLAVKIQPFYFPFTEPSFELAIERPESLRKDDSHAQQWLELLGCGMIHPNVLEAAGINPNTYTGFAWGGGIERLIMMKYGIEDVRLFHSGRMEFLRRFK